MSERVRNSDLIRRWLDEHAAEIDALSYGRVEFVFTAGGAPRAKVERSEQLQGHGPRLSD